MALAIPQVQHYSSQPKWQLLLIRNSKEDQKFQLMKRELPSIPRFRFREIQLGLEWESFGEDAYLSSQMGAAMVAGFDDVNSKYHVASCMKHFIGYEVRQLKRQNL
jgi:hypothetical protein